jgi:hypothetical protein
MTIRTALKEYEQMVPWERLEAAMLMLRLFAGDVEFDHALPSVQWRSEGQYVSSIFLITKTRLIEIRLDAPVLDFDVAALRPTLNYRVSLAEQTVKMGDVEKKLETATITITHGYENFGSELSFVGPGLNAWLTKVCRALPISELIVEGS